MKQKTTSHQAGYIDRQREAKRLLRAYLELDRQFSDRFFDFALDRGRFHVHEAEIREIDIPAHALPYIVSLPIGPDKDGGPTLVELWDVEGHRHMTVDDPQNHTHDQPAAKEVTVRYAEHAVAVLGKLSLGNDGGELTVSLEVKGEYWRDA